MSDTAADTTFDDPAALKRATRAVYFVFIGAGIGGASWASRLPQVREELGLTPAALGLVILAIAVGSLIALPSAGLIVHRLGAARAIVVTAFVFTAGVTVTAIGVRIGVLPVVIGLLIVGFGAGVWDVAMNVEAAVVEQHLGYSIMSRFHAGFSVGTVFGALVGAGMNALNIGVTAHLLLIAALIAVAVPLSTRAFLPAGSEEHAEDHERDHPLRAWLEPRTLLIGLFVLTMAFAEGTANDWLGIAAIDGYDASATLAALTFAVFLAAMTVGRWFGPQILDRYGRVRVLRISALTAVVGLIIVIYGPSLVTALVGTVLWGLGTALGFPVGMSAAADDPRHSAGRVSVVATIGYVAFLAGPPLIGVLGNHTGVLRALTVTAVLLVIGLLAVGATKPLVPAED